MVRTALIVFLSMVGVAVLAQNQRGEWQASFRKAYKFLYSFKSEEALSEFHISMKLAKELRDESLYAKGLFGAGQALWYKSDFNGAIDTVALAIQYFKKEKDLDNSTSALRIMSNIYDDQGNYEKAFEAVSEALELFKNYHDIQNNVLSLVQMGALYQNINDYSTALDYYQSAVELKPWKESYAYRELNGRLGELYVQRSLFDSARFYYHRALIGNPGMTIRLRIGEYFLKKKDYDSAFIFLNSLYRHAQNTNDINFIMNATLDLGQLYFYRHNFIMALAFTQDALKIATMRGARQKKRDAYQLLSSLYERTGEPAKALLYYRQYVLIKDSVLSEQFKGQLFMFKRSNDDIKRLSELHALKNERKLFIVGFVALALIVLFVFFSITLHYKNERLYLKQRASELEMQALRAQMNPHFIFNCLSAINHFVLNKETDRASEYLTRFSRLIRLVLINAGKTTISLEEEVDMLNLYLVMEQLRFKDAFDYYIYYDANVEPSMIKVPSFLLQPYCENAIWHGLLHKPGKGQLNIYFQQEGNILTCTIKDNGIGRQKAAEIKTGTVEKQVSLGHKLTAERLSLFNEGSAIITSFLIEDLKNEDGSIGGTMVVLKINTQQTHD